MKKSNFENRPHYAVRVIRKKRRDWMTKSFSNSMSMAIKHQKDNGLPVARYDIDKKMAYLEYPDGSRKYVEAS